MIKRGHVIIVRFPYVAGGQGKTRPVLVVQTDANNGRLQNTIVAMITGNITLAGKEPTQVLIDATTPEGQSSGLSYPSAIKCENLFTISQSDILATKGKLSATLMDRVNDALKTSLDLK